MRVCAASLHAPFCSSGENPQFFEADKRNTRFPPIAFDSAILRSRLQATIISNERPTDRVGHSVGGQGPLKQIIVTFGTSATGKLSEVKTEVIGEQKRDEVTHGFDGGTIEEGEPMGSIDGRLISVGGESPETLVGVDHAGDQIGFIESGILSDFVGGTGSKQGEPLRMSDGATEELLANFTADGQMTENPNRRMTVSNAGFEEFIFGNIVDDLGEQSDLEFIDSDFVAKHAFALRNASLCMATQ